jgi:hypothetical protein
VSGPNNANTTSSVWLFVFSRFDVTRAIYFTVALSRFMHPFLYVFLIWYIIFCRLLLVIYLFN